MAGIFTFIMAGFFGYIGVQLAKGGLNAKAELTEDEVNQIRKAVGKFIMLAAFLAIVVIGIILMDSPNKTRSNNSTDTATVPSIESPSERSVDVESEGIVYDNGVWRLSNKK